MLSPLVVEFLLEAAAGPAAGGGGDPAANAPSPLGRLLMPLVFVFFIFWFLVIRPESKRRKDRERKVRSVQKGDQVVTQSGIFGKVMKVEDNEILVQIDKEKDVRVRFARQFVLDIITSGKPADLGDGMKN